MPPSRNGWADAYIKQSRSDFTVFEEITLQGPHRECHRLHYLQMACEKMAKAYRFRDTDGPMDDLLTSHIAFSKCIDNILQSPEITRRYHGRDAQLRAVRSRARTLAREIEKLAPAVDREVTPQNAEYPWADGDKAVAPCEYAYPNLRTLKTPEGRSFLELIRLAIEEFERIQLR